MASAPQPNLPLFYKDLMPLNSRDHAKWRTKTLDSIDWLKNQHAVPLTVEELIQGQRNYPIVFSAGDQPVPLALMGLNEGVNTFIDGEGKPIGDFYLPGYVRRYPFMLARLTPDAQELSLCFDPTCKAIGDFKKGEPLFTEDGQPAEPVQAALAFCEQFEQSGARTQQFMEEIAKHDLLMDGELAIQQPDRPDEPFIYRGFKMVDQEKLRDLRGDVLRSMNQSGMLALIFAHLFSLELMSDVFGRQVQQGKGPVPVPAA